jgi:integrase
MARVIGPFPSSDEMRSYYQDMVKRELSPARLGNTIKMFKHWAKYTDLDAPNLTPPNDHNKRIIYLTDVEASRLLYACTDMRDYAMLCIMMYGGLRRKEVTLLTWNDIDFEKRIISVKGTKTHFTADIPISEKAISALILWKEHCSTERVFLITPDRVGRIVKKYARKAGLRKEVTAHVLRHTLATNLLLNGADITLVQKQLRHKNIESTLVYLHITTEKQKELYDRFSPRY